MQEEKFIKLNTVKFGEIEVSENAVFDFVSPIIGFGDLKKYAIYDYKPDSPFKWLQSLEDLELAFPITLCSFFGIDYQFDISDAQKLPQNAYSRIYPVQGMGDDVLY